jgi:hypothetical protein
MPGKIAITSGGAGDVVFSVPIMKALGITTLYIKESYYPEGYGSMYSALKELIELQGFEVLPTKDEGKGFDCFEPGIKFDINMDTWRNCRMRGKWHIAQSMMAHWGIMNRNWKTPWLKIDNEPTELTGTDYSLWFLSPRWRDRSMFDWARCFTSVPGQKYFIGFKSDHEAFCREVGEIEYLHSDNFMRTARLIRDSRTVYCNQGPWLAICQGIGHDYHCLLKPGKTNTMIMLSYEHHLK